MVSTFQDDGKTITLQLGRHVFTSSGDGAATVRARMARIHELRDEQQRRLEARANQSREAR